MTEERAFEHTGRIQDMVSVTEERDVLSAEEVRRAQMGVSQDAPRWKPVDRLADSHEALRACLEETRRERDDFRSRFELRLEVEALARAVAAEADVARLREALREYGRHGTFCAFLTRGFCNCGFTTALSAPVSTPNSQKEEGA